MMQASKNVWFKHIKLLGWVFIGHVRGTIQFQLPKLGNIWHKHKVNAVKAKNVLLSTQGNNLLILRRRYSFYTQISLMSRTFLFI